MSTDPAAAGPAVAGPALDALALSVANLDVTYRVRGQDRLALRDVSFQIGRGESYGLVGESGSGKSTVALALVRYLPSNGRVSAGTISINGQDPLSMHAAALRDLRARTVSMVYQEPGRALNPSLRVGRQIAEVFRIAGQPPDDGHGTRPRKCCARCRSRTRAGSCGGTRTSCPAGWRSGRSSRWRWPSRPRC